MGSAFDNWGAAEGAIYMGANSSWEVVWTLVAIACCIVALVVGTKHEHGAYRKMAGRAKKK